MIISQKSNIVRAAGERSIHLGNLLDSIARHGNKTFKYMGLEADSLGGPIGIAKGLLFELAHFGRMQPLLPNGLISILNNERKRFMEVVVRPQRGDIVFDYKQTSFILDRESGDVQTEDIRYLSDRATEIPYYFTPGAKGIWFDGWLYRTSDVVNLFACNEFAFAVAGGSTIEIFENGDRFVINAIAKKICWGPEGLYFVNEHDQLAIVKEFRYSGKLYEVRSLRNEYRKNVMPGATLVNCQKVVCIVYRSSSQALSIDVIGGESFTFRLQQSENEPIAHFGTFYWQQTLFIFSILTDSMGRLNRYNEMAFKIS